MPAAATTYTTCSGTFYDSGSGSNNYGDNQNSTVTFCSSPAGQTISLTFSQFNIENNWDYMYIYNGPNTASPLLGTYTGTTSPGTISATSGCITIRFTSDVSVTASGWTATIGCGTPPPTSGCLGGTNNICTTADPFCTGTIYNYCNTTDVASLGPYGCLLTTPNPMWMYLKIQTGGNIDIYMEQFTNAGNPIDVDFALYGPYSSLAAACPIGPSTPQIDCSYSVAATETANIVGAVAGQFYMMLITNYANQAGYIEFSQTGGSGTTDCSVLTPCSSTAVGTNPTCGVATGSILVTATAGTAPYNVSWTGTSSGNPNGNEMTATGGTHTIASLAPGTYTITITDATGCVSTQNVTITATTPTQPTVLCYQITTLNPVTCIWNITGTQPAAPTVACYETATWNGATGICAWQVTGIQPAAPAVACYETATWNGAIGIC